MLLNPAQGSSSLFMAIAEYSQKPESSSAKGLSYKAERRPRGFWGRLEEALLRKSFQLATKELKYVTWRTRPEGRSSVKVPHGLLMGCLDQPAHPREGIAHGD